jgi:3-phosphoglycerate kinase
MNRSFLHTTFLNRQRVLVRADLNVPIAQNGTIKNDRRLREIVQTLRFIQSRGGKVILASHIGRPTGVTLEHHLSTRNLIPWFEEQGFAVDFERDLRAAQPKTYKNHNRIMLLENMRFFVGEKNYSMPFAELLADLADIYVNDAFGTLHRSDTSVALLPQLFLPHNRGYGLLVEQEITALEVLHNTPPTPFALVLGGSKIVDKVPLINNFLLHAPPQLILLGGKIALPFLALNGHDLGASKPTDAEIAAAQTVREHLGTTQLILPIDAVTVTQPTQATGQVKDIAQLYSTDLMVDIGPATSTLFTHALRDVKTVFTNGTMGINETERDSAGTAAVLHAIAQVEGIKIVGGGDATAATEQLGLAGKMTFLSTGGGATLSYLSCENPWQALPGLRALGPAV